MQKNSFFQPQGGKFAPNLQFNYKSTRFQSLGEAMMPLPCIRCREWGHYENTCNGPGKNHSSGKRYPPTYCFKCQKWCWHSSTSQYCPTKLQQTFNKWQNPVIRVKCILPASNPHFSLYCTFDLIFLFPYYISLNCAFPLYPTKFLTI